ncbi:hypothetical protein L1285_17460 [Pseudoalteromonas sp. DL2-H2.2]|uniref:hypothetical protein n=1 Tax=Pseudoalteromonas sp. DL2-H2.2 TaxID=2908889 RepID=UPI001F1D0BD1|nr:hypothetical protein [Pseudoalteromonas sp. DL2-H2.2]MCF2910105.1 hypothetical protein [Pseudoalteromonas sp. DL2-H2.2]
MQRTTLITQVLERLTASLAQVAQVDYLIPSQVAPDLTQQAQLTVTPTQERQASELQSKGTDKGVSYGPAYNKNLSPNSLDRRVLSVQLDIELVDGDKARLLERLDEVLSIGEAAMLADDVPTYWQHFIAEQTTFEFTEQDEAIKARLQANWAFYYQVEYPELPGTAITEVYLGQKGYEHKLIYSSDASSAEVV